MEADESELVAKAIGGDMDALSALLAVHGPPIARRLAPQIQSVYRGLVEPEDVMQVTYLEAFLRIRDFVVRGPEAFEVWLGQIAANNLRDAIRELERQKRPPAGQRLVAADSESGPAALLDRVGWTSTTPSRGVVNEELRQRLLAALERLPADYSRVLRLYDLDGNTPDQAARQMNRSVGAIYMLRARAIDQLRTLLGGLASVAGDSA